MSPENRLRSPLTLSALALVAALGLTACGSASTDDDSSNEDSASEAAPEQTAPITDEMIDATELTGEPLAVEEGEGDGTVVVPEHDGPLVVEFENTSENPTTFVSGESDTGQLLDGPSTGESLITLLDPFPYEGDPQEISSEIEITTMGPTPYRVSFYPLDSVPVVADGQGVEATGPGIFRWQLEHENHYELAIDDDTGYAATAWGLDSDELETLLPSVSGGGEEVPAGEYLVSVEHEPEQSWSYTPITDEVFESDFAQQSNATTLDH